MYLACPATTSFLAICGANYRTFFCINNKNDDYDDDDDDDEKIRHKKSDASFSF